MQVPIEISARHIHLSTDDFKKLFGDNELRSLRKLSQPGQFAANQTVSIGGPKGKIENVRIIGPFREQTQLEISKTDSYVLGIDSPPVLLSGNLEKSVGGVEIIGPNGNLKMSNGVIVAKRHLHISPEEAEKFNLQHLDIIKIKISSDRSLVFDDVVVRSRENIDKLSFQLDTDEANAADVRSGDMGEIIQ